MPARMIRLRRVGVVSCGRMRWVWCESPPAALRRRACHKGLDAIGSHDAYPRRFTHGSIGARQRNVILRDRKLP
jgi:hypothetical protein